jgi:hypothetical protein
VGSRLGLILVGVLAALAVAGCGGSDSATTRTETVTVEADDASPLSKAEWIERADAICEENDEEIEPLGEKFDELQDGPGSDQKSQEGAEVLREVTASRRGAYERIDELEPPPGDQQLIEKMLDTAEAGLTYNEQIADGLEADDYSAITDGVEQREKKSAAASGMAEGYGLEVCGSD